MYFAHSGRVVYCCARFPLSPVQKTHKTLRQCAGRRVALARRKMPELQVANFTDVSAGGTRDRAAFCGVLLVL